ncbi:unnamed protein product [Lampetra planeri]
MATPEKGGDAPSKQQRTDRTRRRGGSAGCLTPASQSFSKPRRQSSRSSTVRNQRQRGERRSGARATILPLFTAKWKPPWCSLRLRPPFYHRSGAHSPPNPKWRRSCDSCSDSESQKKIEREREKGGGWHGVSITAAARRLTLPLTDAMRLHWQRADSAEDGPTGRWPGGGMGEPLASLGIPLASGATPRSWHPLLTQKDGARPSHTCGCATQPGGDQR